MATPREPDRPAATPVFSLLGLILPPLWSVLSIFFAFASAVDDLPMALTVSSIIGVMLGVLCAVLAFWRKERWRGLALAGAACGGAIALVVQHALHHPRLPI